MVAAFAKIESEEENETWNRAYIMSIGSSSYRVNFCDVGLIGNVKTVKKLPQNLTLIPELAARCSVISCTSPKEKLWSAVSKKLSPVTALRCIQSFLLNVIFSVIK